MDLDTPQTPASNAKRDGRVATSKGNSGLAGSGNVSGHTSAPNDSASFPDVNNREGGQNNARFLNGSRNPSLHTRTLSYPDLAPETGSSTVQTGAGHTMLFPPVLAYPTFQPAQVSIGSSIPIAGGIEPVNPQSQGALPTRQAEEAAAYTAFPKSPAEQFSLRVTNSLSGRSMSSRTPAGSSSTRKRAKGTNPAEPHLQPSGASFAGTILNGNQRATFPARGSQPSREPLVGQPSTGRISRGVERHQAVPVEQAATTAPMATKSQPEVPPNVLHSIEGPAEPSAGFWRSQQANVEHEMNFNGLNNDPRQPWKRHLAQESSSFLTRDSVTKMETRYSLKAESAKAAQEENNHTRPLSPPSPEMGSLDPFFLRGRITKGRADLRNAMKSGVRQTQTTDSIRRNMDFLGAETTKDIHRNMDFLASEPPALLPEATALHKAFHDEELEELETLVAAGIMKPDAPLLLAARKRAADKKEKLRPDFHPVESRVYVEKWNGTKSTGAAEGAVPEHALNLPGQRMVHLGVTQGDEYLGTLASQINRNRVRAGKQEYDRALEENDMEIGNYDLRCLCPRLEGAFSAHLPSCWKSVP